MRYLSVTLMLGHWKESSHEPKFSTHLHVTPKRLGQALHSDGTGPMVFYFRRDGRLGGNGSTVRPGPRSVTPQTALSVETP